MMTARAVWLAGVAAMMPLMAAASPTGPSPAVNAIEPFIPPEGSMLLTRTTRRPLSGGKEVVARRSYEVRFLRESGGYRLEGKLLEVSVDAPPQLRALAELERQRPDGGMFPMRLDAAGRLMPGGFPHHSQAGRDAMAAVSANIAASDLGSLEKAQAQIFVSGFHERQAYNPWPEELFRPSPGKRRETRTIPLVNGARGQVFVDTVARTVGPSGLLASFSRTVTSNLDGDMRATYEDWSLTPP